MDQWKAKGLFFFRANQSGGGFGFPKIIPGSGSHGGD